MRDASESSVSSALTPAPRRTRTRAHTHTAAHNGHDVSAVEPLTDGSDGPQHELAINYRGVAT